MRNVFCGICEKECPIGAIKVTKNDEQYEFAKKKIEEDERTIKDLFIDRYGAVAISDFFKINIDEIEEKVKKKGLSLIEIYNPDEAECLLKSIPIKTLTKDLPNETVFYKAEYEKCINDKYKINDFPCILVFQNGYLLGIIEGYFTIDEKEIVLSKLNDILTKENSKR